jgi:hypothetical protein
MLGPVFSWELVRAGRRRWHWWARALYVCLLLLFLWATFGDVTRFLGPEVSHRVFSEIGARFYQGVSYYQLLAVLLLAPVYAATSVCEEKTRRTLPYLLTSRLRDDEIVLGKIGLAVLRVWEVLLCGLPLCALCLLMGGVNPEFMFFDFLLAMAAAWASCALGVLTAILSRRLSEALLLVLLMQMLWYGLPAADFIARNAGRGFYIPAALLEMNAFKAIYQGQTPGAVDPWHGYIVCLTATTLFALSLSLAAWWVLRPAWQREEERRPIRLLLRRLRRPRPAQQVWDQPFLWRELRSRSATSVDRIVWALYLAVAVGVLIGIASSWEITVRTIRLSGTMMGMPPPSLMIALFTLPLYLIFLAFPYLAITGATAFAEERDGNHFDLLCITLLDQRHLVHAKAARLARVGLSIMALPMLLEVLLLAMGWTTWWALRFATLHCVAAGAFALILGMALSLRLAKTSQAIVLTLGLLLAIGSVGPLMTNFVVAEFEVPLIMTCPPAHCMFLSMADNLVEPQRFYHGITLEVLRAISLFYTLAYALGALVMYWWALQPAPPWRAEHPLWLSYAITESRRSLAAAPSVAPQPAESL